MSVREPYVDVNLWHSGYPNHSFESWEKSYSRRFAEKTQIATGVSDTDKLPVREIFLMSKYFDKWIVNMWRKKQRNHQTSSSQTEVIIASPLWLKSVIFNKSSRTVRRVIKFRLLVSLPFFPCSMFYDFHPRWHVECWTFLDGAVGTDQRKWLICWHHS